MLNLYIINLASSSQRWETTSARLKELNVPFERFEAIDGRKTKHPLFDRYDDKQREKYRRKPLSNGELGCFSSHYLLWEKCIELNQPIVVMEDDVIINNSLNEALEIAEQEIVTLRYLRLAGTILKRRPYKKVKTIGSFDLSEHIRGPSGALCYIVTPQAAKAFIKYADKWVIAVDDYMDRYWEHSVDCYSLMPFPITFGDNKSDIPRLPKEKWPLWKKIRKEVYGVLERLSRYWYRFNRQS